jgi:hypothetical protein
VRLSNIDHLVVSLKYLIDADHEAQKQKAKDGEEQDANITGNGRNIGAWAVRNIHGLREQDPEAREEDGPPL